MDSKDTINFGHIGQPDEVARAEAMRLNERLSKPVGSLGKLEPIGAWITACQGRCPPRPFTRPRLTVFAGDHGIAAKGVSAYQGEATARLAGHLLNGDAALNAIATSAGVGLRIVDMAIASDDSSQALTNSVTEFKVNSGSGSIDTEDALTDSEVRQAIRAGIAIADAEVDGGADLLIAGELGVGATTSASIVIAALTGAEPVAVVGRGSGIDDNTWMRKAAAVRDGLRRAKAHVMDPLALLRTAGGADLAAITGFLAQAACRRTPVLLDGVVVGAAAMLAEELAQDTRSWWMAAHRCNEPAHGAVLEHLDLEPLLDLDIRGGAGEGALAAFPLLCMAARVLAETVVER